MYNSGIPRGVHRVVYTRVYLPVYLGGIYQGVPTIPRVYLGGIYQGVPPTMPPWVHHSYTMPTTGTTVSMLVHPLPDDEALGSTLGIVRDLRRVETSFLPKV